MPASGRERGYSRALAGRKHRMTPQGSSPGLSTSEGASMNAVLPALVLSLLACAVSVPARAGAVLDRVKSAGTVRVCIWSDYYGITFPNLIDDLLGDRCDVSMHAVAVLPARAEKLRFSQPYLQSDIYGITTRSQRAIKRWEDIDQPGVQVAVQAGTFMEPVMAGALKQATMVVVRPPQTREGELEAGRVDVFMTDYPYSRRLLDNADWARLIAPPRPFHVLPYAYAVKPGDAEWLAQLDAFVGRIKKDGRLAAAAGRFGLTEIVVR